MDRGISISLMNICMMCGLEELEPVDPNRSEHALSALLLRTLAVGRRQQSESMEVALIMK